VKRGEGEREDEAGSEQREGAWSRARDRRRDADQLRCAQRREVARRQVHRRRRDAACVRGRPSLRGDGGGSGPQLGCGRPREGRDEPPGGGDGWCVGWRLWCREEEET
jgi:hypothetical protein